MIYLRPFVEDVERIVAALELFDAAPRHALAIRRPFI